MHIIFLPFRCPLLRGWELWGHLILVKLLVDPHPCHLNTCKVKLHFSWRRRCDFWPFQVWNLGKGSWSEITIPLWSPSVRPTSVPDISSKVKLWNSHRWKYGSIYHIRGSNFGAKLRFTIPLQSPLCRCSSGCNMEFVHCTVQPQCTLVTNRQTTDVTMPMPALCILQNYI